MKITEAGLQRTILEAARWHGFRVCHFRPAQTKKGWRTPIEGDAGFPDLVLALDGHVLCYELKTQRGRLSEEQALWYSALGAERGGIVEAALVRPKDLDAVLEHLGRIAQGLSTSEPACHSHRVGCLRPLSLRRSG